MHGRKLILILIKKNRPNKNIYLNNNTYAGKNQKIITEDLDCIVVLLSRVCNKMKRMNNFMLDEMMLGVIFKFIAALH